MGRIILNQIALQKIKVISETKKYFLLQPSSAAAPSTSNYGITPPTYTQTGYSGWSDTEPSYTIGDERVLYELTETIYSDRTWDYSTPTISSSYEAAKEAYNEAIEAGQTIAEFEELGLKQGYIWDNATYVAPSGSVPVYPVGSYIASGILVNGERSITHSNSNTYGLNTWISTGGINLRYNAIDLMKLTTSNLLFYYPSTSTQQKKAISLGTNGAVNSLAFYGFNSDNKTMELTNGALTFYDPSNGTSELAVLNTNGLILKKGGVKAGTANQSGFIYLSTENYGSYSINGSTGISDWKEIIGTKFGVRADGTLYASNAVISGTITVGSGSNVYTKTESDDNYDASGSASAAQAAAISAAATDATNKANAAQAAAIASAAEDATTKADAVNNALEAYKTSTNSTLTNLQNQVDGQVEVWYYSIDPTTSNPPASSWNTDALKARHEGDLYYNIENGHSWRWIKNNNVYSWQQIPDGDAAAALAKATEALGVANNKRRIFTAQPTTPYEVGDLWVNGSEVKYCKTSRVSGDYVSTDWTLTATDDTKANSAAFEEQYIYISKASGTTSVPQNTSWVTRSDDVQNIWTTKRPTYDTSYPVLFIAKQKKTVGQSSGSTCTCTPPVKDDTTTVIDGGHITTGTIDASRLNVNDIISSGSIVVQDDISNMAEKDDIPTKVSDLSDGGDYTKTVNLGSTTAVQNAAKTASNYLGDTDSNAGVTLKAQNGTTTANTSTSNYIKINASGLEIFKGGVSVALYGDTARIGKSNNSRFLLNADSLQAYNSSNTKYFEVSANGITYGNNTVASTSYADGKANTAEDNAKTAAQGYADAAEANASYSVEIKVDSINYTTNSAKLIAVPYQKGTVTTGTFNWYKNNTSTAHGGTVSTTTNRNDTLTITDLNASYIAVLQ